MLDIMCANLSGTEINFQILWYSSVVEPVKTTTVGLFPIAGVSMLRQAQQPQAQRPLTKILSKKPSQNHK